MAVLTGGEEFLSGDYKMAGEANVDLSALGEQRVGQGIITGGWSGVVGVGQVSGAGLDEHAEHLAGGEFSQV